MPIINTVCSEPVRPKEIAPASAISTYPLEFEPADPNPPCVHPLTKEVTKARGDSETARIGKNSPIRDTPCSTKLRLPNNTNAIIAIKTLVTNR